MRTLKDQGCGSLPRFLGVAVESLRFPLQPRRGRISTARWFFALLLLTLAGLSSSVRAQQYLVTEIPAPADYPMAPPLGYAINAIGEVTGEFDPIEMSIQPYAPISPRLFVYASGNGSAAGTDANGYAIGITTDLGAGPCPLGIVGAIGYGINSSGQVVGNLCATEQATTGFIYGNGQFFGFGETGGIAASATAVNATALVTGTIEFPVVSGGNCSGLDEFHAFIYNAGTAALDDLGTLSNGGCASFGLAINDAGQIAGYFIDSLSAQHAYIYSVSNGLTDLGNLGYPYIQALGINHSGQVTGSSNRCCGYGPDAFLYSNGSMQDLGNLGGPLGSIGNQTTGGSTGNAINSGGQVTGQSWTAGNAAQHAFIYSNGSMLDLNGLIPAGLATQYTLVNGVAINDAGQIVVQGYVNSNPSQTVTFLLTPTTTVPNVVGLTQAAATTAITGANLTLGIVTTQASTTVPSGEVVSQSPAAGLVETDGTAVNLVISTGPPTTTVPNVVGLTQAAATTAITGARLTLGTVTTQASATVPVGEVVSQSPVAGLSESDGTAVSLTISTGSPTTTVPNVVGLTQATATTAITGANLTLGTVTTQPSVTVASGEVVSESPAAGVSASDGAAVNLIISAGPPTVGIVLSGAPTIASYPQGWLVTVNLANSGNVTVQTLQETSATLNGVAPTTVSVPSGHVFPISGLSPGSSAVLYFMFPRAAGAPGATVRFTLNGSYAATGLSGNWSVSLRSVTLP